MPDPAILGPWLRRFFTEHIVSERNLARNTRKSYRDTFRLLLPFVSRKVRKPVDRLAVSDITSGCVRQFLAHLETDRGCSIPTRNQRLAAIRAFARFVGSRDPAHVEWCGHIRAIASKRSVPSPVGWLTRAEMEAMLATPDRCWRSRKSADIRSFQSRGRRSVSSGSPARSRMSMSFQSSPSMAGRRRTILVSLRASRAAARSPWRVAS